MNSDDTNSALIEMRVLDDIPSTKDWPNFPVMICVNTPVPGKILTPEYGNGPCPIGVPFRFESELFEGTALIRIKDAISDNLEGDATYFNDRRRRFQSIVQGRFKKEISVADVLTGHEFVRPLKNLPSSWIISAATSLIRKIAPGTEVNLNNSQPNALSTLAATSQAVRVDIPGKEPSITSLTIEEDCHLLSSDFKNMSAAKRKKTLKYPAKAKKYMYDTKNVYTFDFYQDMLDVNTYTLSLGFFSSSLAKYLDGQPIQFMSKVRNGEYLWSFQIWHESLIRTLEKKESKLRLSRRSIRISRMLDKVGIVRRSSARNSKERLAISNSG